MSNSSSSSIDAVVGILTQEGTILKQLLYRNFNQHRRTKLYGFLTAVQKELDFLLLIQWDTKFNEANAVLSNLKKKSDSSFHTSKAIQNLADLNSLLSDLLECDSWLCRAGRLIRVGLQEMIFVPLFTTWMALLSAIGGAVAELMGHVVACILPLKNTLTEISIQSHELAPLIQSCPAMQCLDSIAVRSRLLTLFQSFGIKHSLRLDNTISDTMNDRDTYSISSKKSHVNSENRMNVNYSVSDIITATSTSTSTSAANTISHPSSKNSSFTSKKVHPIDNNTYMNNNDEDLGDSVVIHSYSANVVVAEAKVSVGSSYTIDTSSPIISANTSSATTKEKSIISAIKSNSNNYSHKINYMKSNSGGNVSERKTTSSSKKRKMRVSVDGNSNEYECDYIDNIFGNL